MRLIIGLGNPGREYVSTRHNAGFMVIDELVRRNSLDKPKHKFHAECYDGQILNQKVVLLKPMTYMNRSGLTVGEAAKFYKVEAHEVMVVVDDVALPCGRIRLRQTGSAGGHNGLSDIERVLSTRDYPRLRVGIDEPGRVPQKDYVLGRFSAQQLRALEPALTRASKAIEDWLSTDIEKVMSLYNAAE